MVAERGRRSCRPSDRPSGRAPSPRALMRACSCSAGSNGVLAGAVGDQLDAAEQAAAAQVADMRMIAEALVQARLQARRPGARTAASRSSRADHLLHRQRGRAGHRMADIGVAVLEHAAAFGEGVDDRAAAPAPRRSAGSRRRGPWRSSCRSGTTPSCSQACSVPVRPMPHITSSRISRMPWRSQISRTPREVAGHRRQRARGRADRRSRRRRRSRCRRRARRSRLDSSRTSRAPYCSALSSVAPVAVFVARRHVAAPGSGSARTGGAAIRCRRPPARRACCRDSSAGAR